MYPQNSHLFFKESYFSLYLVSFILEHRKVFDNVRKYGDKFHIVKSIYRNVRYKNMSGIIKMNSKCGVLNSEKIRSGGEKVFFPPI